MKIKDNNLIVLDGSRIFVPSNAVPQILKLLHIGHPGIVKSKQLARKLYYWPNFSNDITQNVKQCHKCLPLLPRQQPDLVIHQISLKPMDACGLDMAMYNNNNYAVMVDRFSGFPFAQKVNSTSSTAIIKILRHWFSFFGPPKTLLTDGAPNLTSEEFNKFCESQGIVHEISSVANPASNGLSEAAVKNVKHLIKTAPADDLDASLAAFRITPRQDGISPAELFLHRQPRSHLPSLESTIIPETSRPARKFNIKKTAESKSLKLHDYVAVYNTVSNLWNDYGQIVSIRQSGRSYDVKLITGATRAVNNRFLRKLSFNTFKSIVSALPIPVDPVLRVRNDALTGPASNTRSKSKI